VTAPTAPETSTQLVVDEAATGTPTGGQPAPSVTSPADDAGALLATWDAWHCQHCGSRWFEPSRCCGTTPTPVRMEMHRRIP
jgi:hypothetical protein